MNDVNEIESKLIKFLRQRFEIPESDPKFTVDADLFNFGYVDSFGALDLNTFIEQEFSIKLSDSDLANVPLNSVREICRFINIKQGA